jgi:hypothetical protein
MTNERSRHSLMAINRGFKMKFAIVTFPYSMDTDKGTGIWNASLFGDFLRSTLSWWRRVKISASSEDFNRNNPMTAHQISLRMSPIGASITRFAAIRQMDRVYINR